MTDEELTAIESKPSPTLAAGDVAALLAEVRRLQAERDCWRALAETDAGYNPFHHREAVERGDVAQCKQWAAEWRQHLAALYAERDSLRAAMGRVGCSAACDHEVGLCDNVYARKTLSTARALLAHPAPTKPVEQRQPDMQLIGPGGRWPPGEVSVPTKPPDTVAVPRALVEKVCRYDLFRPLGDHIDELRALLGGER